ncbi:MAG: (2Fe-2S)-binding protein [Candidatus Riflebacteria bacterium]|nr:(2Fe-2S)-binding protein [Candidatus Riflebacteria bacterium]
MKIICRCQDITEEEVIAAIKQGATTIDEIKRLVRAGMGPCQGRTCRRLVSQIISRELKKPVTEIFPPTFRPPNLPVPFKHVIAELERQEKEKTGRKSKRGAAK